jgi:hypothetical protein
MIRRRATVGLACALAALALALVAPGSRPARACGGLFCNNPPADPFAPLPVAQTGENVVFAVDTAADGTTTVTAHIQILYSGPADKFSWVVPVDAVPQLGTGTDQLFTSLAQLTQPRFQPDYQIQGTCIIPPNYGGTGSGGAADTGFGGAAGTTGAGGTSGGGVTVAFQGAIGPFDAAVISSTDGQALRDWLTTNGYYVGPDASAIIDAYVQEGKVFVALKLLNGQGVSAIRPITLTFHGTEPCVPLRLTAIAALPDMQVRVWVLGASRAVPQRFFELKLDELRIDWTSGGSNYATLLGQAADEAGGNAFVTEYAGTSTVAAGALWSPGRFNLDTLKAAMTPPAYVQLVLSMGLASDPQTLPLLEQYIPMPDAVRALGITDSQFYSNIATYWAQYAFPPYDLATLTDQIDVNIIQPRQDAQMMIDAHLYLTRLNTFISPIEMTQDPLFTFDPDLPDQSATHTAVIRSMCGDRQYMQCNAPIRLELPDGRMAWLRSGSTAATCQYQPYNQLPTTLPAAEIVWQRDDSGEGARRIDNTAVIQAQLTQYNSTYPESTTFPMPSTSSGAGGAGLVPDSTGAHGSGCACASGGGGGGAMALGSAGLLVLAVFATRRRIRGRTRMSKLSRNVRFLAK